MSKSDDDFEAIPFEKCGIPAHIQRGLCDIAKKLDVLGGQCPDCGASAEAFRCMSCNFSLSLGIRYKGTCETCKVGPCEDIL